MIDFIKHTLLKKKKDFDCKSQIDDLQNQKKKCNLNIKQAQKHEVNTKQQIKKHFDRKRKTLEIYTSPKLKKIERKELKLKNDVEGCKLKKESTSNKLKEERKKLVTDQNNNLEKCRADSKRTCEKELNNIFALRNADNWQYQKSLNEVLLQLRSNSLTPAERERKKIEERDIENHHHTMREKWKVEKQNALDSFKANVKNLKEENDLALQSFDNETSNELSQYDNSIEVLSQKLGDVQDELAANEEYQEKQTKLRKFQEEEDKEIIKLENVCLKNISENENKLEQLQLAIETLISHQQIRCKWIIKGV